MRISTKGRYALRMMIDLAQHSEAGTVRMREIAERQGFSVKYLEQIAILLTKAGLLKGTRGPGGGYRFARPATELTPLDILAATEKTLAPVACLKKKSVNCPLKSKCVTLSFWQGLHNTVTSYLSSTTLAELAEKNISL